MPAGIQHDPPRFLDESSTFLTIGGQDEGYVFRLETQLAGYTSKSDAIRLEWKQGGKTLATAKCKVSDSRDAKLVALVCDQREQTLKAKGAIDAELIYKDDGDDHEYLIRTFKVSVVEWAKKTWQLAADDLLGAAYAIDSHHQSISQVPRPRFRFWIASGEMNGTATLRCTVDGAALPDLPASFESTTRLDADILPAKGERVTWKWTQVEVEANTLMDGAKAGGSDVALAAHPGAWACLVRLDGRPLRELRFQVTADGTIASHPMQGAARSAPLAPGVALIDVRIPRDAGIDQRIKPEQLRKSRGFGLPWPSDPSVAAIHAAFPAAVETPKPVAPKAVAKAGAGKLLPGASHDPPRFVDEASTSVRLSRNADGKTDGYAFHVYAMIAGTTSKADRVRLDWKQGGKLIASAKCTVDKSERDALGLDHCDYEGKPLTAKGAIEAELIYSDDVEGNDYLVRTYKVTVAKYPSFGDAVYQVVADDVLGAAWVRHWYPQILNDSRAGHPHFAFWVAAVDNFLTTPTTLRCTVGGAKLADISLGLETGDGGTIEASTLVSGKTIKYVWNHLDATANVYFGKASEYPQGADKSAVFLADHAGAWACQLRQEGNVLRELAFTVSDKGFISSGLQTAPGAAPTLSNTAAVELRFPKAAKLDTRVRPDAMKRSRGFGLPWPTGPVVQAVQATFPPASGLPDPK